MISQITDPVWHAVTPRVADFGADRAALDCLWSHCYGRGETATGTVWHSLTGGTRAVSAHTSCEMTPVDGQAVGPRPRTADVLVGAAAGVREGELDDQVLRRQTFFAHKL